MDNNCKMIHETSLGHIMDIWDSLMDIKADSKKLKSSSQGPLKGASSIAKAASNLTMVFPVLCTRGISIESSSMITKALEKNIVSMLQRLFASWQLADASVTDVQDYISKFHGNISSKVASLDDVFRMTDSASNFKNGGSLKFDASVAANEAAIREDMKNINFYLPNSISESALTRFSINEDGTTTINKNVGLDDSNNSDMAGNVSKNGKFQADATKTRTEIFKNQVPDSDFKKANELMPTTMIINFNVDKGDGTPVAYQSALTAVKAKLYPVSSEDIVSHISDKVIDKNWITNFFRASTREISFMKDFVLALDKAKIDALSNSERRKTTDKMWKVLERRALTSRLKRAMRRPDSASVAAITTLVISQEEVEYLRKYNNVDIEKVSTIMNLFDSLNLMCICIVDESLEVAKFIYDEQEPTWETISFTHLEREASDNTYKKVVNLMTKVSR